MGGGKEEPGPGGAFDRGIGMERSPGIGRDGQHRVGLGADERNGTAVEGGGGPIREFANHDVPVFLSTRLTMHGVAWPSPRTVSISQWPRWRRACTIAGRSVIGRELVVAARCRAADAGIALDDVGPTSAVARGGIAAQLTADRAAVLAQDRRDRGGVEPLATQQAHGVPFGMQQTRFARR